MIALILISIVLFLTSTTDVFAQKLTAFPADYEKKRIIISSDVGGGDPDDAQSMIHFLAYANMFDLEGIIISRPKGKKSKMLEIIRAYKKDYRKFLKVSPDYPSPRQLRKLIRVGASVGQKTPAIGFSSPTPGSRLIIRAARKDDPRPLHVMAWGSATDIAQAIANAPSIKKKILVYAGGTKAYNYDNDPAPVNFLRKPFNQDLRWIDAFGAGSGMFCTGTVKPKRKYGNIGFVDKVVKNKGALGRLYLQESCRIGDISRCGIKMSDTVQLFFLMNGSFENPKKTNWGGKYCKIAKNRFTECPGYDLCGRPGGATVAKFRKDWLQDWEQRLNWIYN